MCEGWKGSDQGNQRTAVTEEVRQCGINDSFAKDDKMT
jgi:hypothetical protein